MDRLKDPQEINQRMAMAFLHKTGLFKQPNTPQGEQVLREVRLSEIAGSIAHDRCTARSGKL